MSYDFFFFFGGGGRGGSGRALKLLNTSILHYVGLHGGKINYTKFVLAFPDFGTNLSKLER